MSKKDSKKETALTVKPKADELVKKRKFKRGTVARREIKKLGKYNGLVVAPTTIGRLVLRLANEEAEKIPFAKKAIDGKKGVMLQHNVAGVFAQAASIYLINKFRQAALQASYGTTVPAKTISLRHYKMSERLTDCTAAV